MAGGSNGYRAALVRRRLMPGLISSSLGTARFPPSISFSTSCPKPAVARFLLRRAAQGTHDEDRFSISSSRCCASSNIRSISRRVRSSTTLRSRFSYRSILRRRSSISTSCMPGERCFVQHHPLASAKFWMNRPAQTNFWNGSGSRGAPEEARGAFAPRANAETSYFSVT